MYRELRWNQRRWPSDRDVEDDYLDFNIKKSYIIKTKLHVLYAKRSMCLYYQIDFQSRIHINTIQF